MIRVMTAAIIGSISRGTLRPRDLLATFANILETLDTEGEFIDEIMKARASITLINANWPLVEESENVTDLINELINILTKFAPPYCYFGPHPDDGSDFGFWPDWERIDVLPWKKDAKPNEDCVEILKDGTICIYNVAGEIILKLN